MRRVLALLIALPLLSGCFGGDPTIALLLADGSDDQHTVDVEAFTERVESSCEECRVEVHDAGGDAAEQKSQARQALADDADVLVIWPVDPGADVVTDDEASTVSLVQLVPGSDRFVGMAEELPAGVAQQGSDLEAAREVITGKRKSMVYVPDLAISERAADVTVALMAEQPVADSELHEGVRSWLYEPTEVTLDNLTTVLVGGGVLTIDELCEGATARRCQALGLI